MVSDVEEMILKPIKYSILGLTHILSMADIAFQEIYEIIAFAIPIHHSIEGMCCAMPGYIAIMAGLIHVQCWEVLGLLHWGWDTCLPLKILAQAKKSLMHFSFLNVTVMDIHSCTDAGTHSNPGVGQDERWMQHTDGATQGHTFAWSSAKRRSRYREFGVHVYMYWCMCTV